MKVRHMALLTSLALGTGWASAQVAPPLEPDPQQPQIQQDQPVLLAPRMQDQQINKIASFVGDSTVAVGKLNLKQVDVAAAEGWLQDFVKAAEPNPQRQEALQQQLTSRMDLAQNWVEDMRQAGAETIYSVMNQQEQGPLVSALVVPLDQGDDAARIQQLLMPKADPNQMDLKVKLNSAVIRDTVVVAPQNMLDAFRQPLQGDPESLQTALESVSDAAIQVAFVPTKQMRLTAQQMADRTAGNLPQGVVAGDLRTIPEKIEWAAMGIDSPPEQSLKLVANATDEQSAQSVSQVIGAVLTSLTQNQQIAAQVQDIDRIAKALQPEVKDDRLVLTLNKQQFNRLFQEDLAQALRQARGQQPIRAGQLPQDQQQEQQPQDIQIQPQQR